MGPDKTSSFIFYQKTDQADLTGSEIFDLSSSHIFNRDNHRIHIRVHQLVFEKVLKDGAAHIDSGYGLVDEFILDGICINNVGIRVRGNTSAGNIKRQFKFKFDAERLFTWKDGEFKMLTFSENDDRRFFGIQAFSVRCSQNDPTRIREMLAGKIFREAAITKNDDDEKEDKQRPWRNNGGLVYRCGFASLYVTNGRTVEEGYDDGYPEYRVAYQGRLYDPKGLYVITENIDKTFLKTRFERFDGEKIKAYMFQADKGKAYFKKDKYNRIGWKCKLVKGKKPKEEKDYVKADEKMLYLINILENEPNEKELKEIFDMDSVNAYYAGALLTTHWDSLAANRNNDFMLYLKRNILDDNMKCILDDNGEEMIQRKWYMITWDLDNTLWDKSNANNDVMDPYENWFSNYIYNPARKDDNKTLLTKVILDNQDNNQIRNDYRELLTNLLKGFYETNQYEYEIDQLMKRTSNAIQHTKQQVEKAAWMKHWGEYNKQSDFDEIKHHARVRTSKVGAQL